MKYDKHSFLAGLSVGTQLKGWASAGGSGEGGAQHVKMPSVGMPLLDAGSKQHKKTASVGMSLLAIDIRIAK